MNHQPGMEQEMRNVDWEKAFDWYENVIAQENEFLQIQATGKLAHMSDYAPVDILIRAVPVLVECLRIPLSNLSPSIQEASSYCLKCIACIGEGRLAATIGQSGAIPLLLRLLSNSEGRFQRVLLKCIRNIVTFEDSNRMIVFRNGGFEIILTLLNSSPDSSRRFLLEILSALALLREVRRALLSSGDLCFLVESAKTGSMISRMRAAQAIGLLGLVKRSRRQILDSGGIPVLMELLQNGDTQTKLVAGNALGLITSHVHYIRELAEAGAIPLYAQLLQGSDPMGKEIAENVFCILAVSKENAITIVEHLVRILKGDNNVAKAAAADVLWDLSSYKHLVSVLQNSDAIPILVELLRDDNGDVREKVSAAITQLSYNKEHRMALADSGAIPLLIDMLQDESDETRDNAAETLVNFTEDPLMGDGISHVLDNPSFQSMQDRLMQIRASNSHLPLRDISSELTTLDSSVV